MADAHQSFTNHTKWDPQYHFFLAPVALITFLAVSYHTFRHPDLVTGWQWVLSVALVVGVLHLRIYPLKVQDRIIRLEERLRLATLVTPEFRPRIHELSERQLIALRFCSDAELPALAERALSEKLDGKTIKAQIKTWRADDFRV